MANHSTSARPFVFLAAACTLPFVLINLIGSLVNRNLDVVSAILAAGQVALALCGAVWLWAEGGWKARFFLNIARAMKVAREVSAEDYMGGIECLNLAGKAARNLFCAMQKRRRTWVSPPVVADLTLALAYPLIDMELADVVGTQSMQRNLQVYASFLYYSAALVAVSRCDPIPPLRRYYEEVHSLARRRTSESPDQIPERDALFLDPMRNHNRWTVAKDYLYPLAAWFGFLVSTAALIVSIAS